MKPPVTNTSLQIKYQGRDSKKDNFHRYIIDVKYPQFYICAKKGSGKSNLVLCLLKKMCIPIYSRVLYVSPTLSHDICYQKCIRDFRTLCSFEILPEFDQEKIMEFLEREEHPIFDKLPQHCIPKFLVIDDNRTYLKDKFSSWLSTVNRHKHCCILWVGHSLCDILVDQRNQMDCLFIYKGQDQKKLERIYEEYIQDPYNLDFGTFQNMYLECTSKQHDFMFFDICSQTFRKNLDQQFVKKDDTDQFYLQNLKNG